MSPTPPPPSDAATEPALRFSDLALAESLITGLAAIGYETPSPIQARTIPPLLEGRDLLGQAQTGTGKTAAFALPILTMLDLSLAAPQALVLAPTRELAIQVAEAFQKYAGNMPGFHVVPIYGGQSYTPQLKALKRGAQVVVGTPGRVVDHIKRGTLRLDKLKHLVLDEADEMLRMGFIDDVEWVLEQIPKPRQIALFSATMPSVIRRVAQTHLNSPVEVTIAAKTTTGTNIRQRYWLVSGLHKLDALTRFLETEDFDGMIVFARTKAMTVELAEKLEARGYSARALNGDMQQAERERTVSRFKDGQIDILVATDIAARGLDVDRISHVLNYDIPTDTESYVHRIGRTGRAGRSGQAILFVAPRERHLLRAIERATRQTIEAISAPSPDAVNQRRIDKFKQTISDTIANVDSDHQVGNAHAQLRAILSEFAAESGSDPLDIAAALAQMLKGDRPVLLTPDNTSTRRPPRETREPRESRPATPTEPSAGPFERPAPRAADARPKATPASASPTTAPREDAESRAPRPGPVDALHADRKRPEVPSETFRIEVGSKHGVKPGNIVGAIANEAGLDSQFIGRVEIFETYSFVDLPSGMPKVIFKDLRKTWVCGQQLQITRLNNPAGADPTASDSKPRRSADKDFSKRPGGKPSGKRPPNRKQP